MRECEVKSTGTLVDELLTTDLKWDAGAEVQDRRHELANTVTGRTAVLLDDMTRYREFQQNLQELKVILKLCWDAQEVIMSSPDPTQCTQDQLMTLAIAAKEAQRTNAIRNRYIRKMDELVGETERTQLAKTYDKE